MSLPRLVLDAGPTHCLICCCPVWTLNYRDFGVFTNLSFWNPASIKKLAVGSNVEDVGDRTAAGARWYLPDRAQLVMFLVDSLDHSLSMGKKTTFPKIPRRVVASIATRLQKRVSCPLPRCSKESIRLFKEVSRADTCC
jgi:hypothetical protein